jgi:hypothetical protein
MKVLCPAIVLRVRALDKFVVQTYARFHLIDPVDEPVAQRRVRDLR